MSLPTKLQLQIVSADRSLVNESVDEVEIPGSDGYFGVLPGHTPLLALLGTGELWYRQGQERTYLLIAFGFAEVQPERVTILAEIAEKAEEIDLARAQAATEAGRGASGQAAGGHRRRPRAHRAAQSDSSAFRSRVEPGSDPETPGRGIAEAQKGSVKSNPFCHSVGLPPCDVS